MTTPQKVVLLACGSYNPPTNMHLRMFELARDHLHQTSNCHVVAGLISPVHDKYGKEGLAGSNDRCQMVRLALTSSDWVHLSDWETREDDWTPTRRVLEHHQELMDSLCNGNLQDGTNKRPRMDTAWLSHLAQPQGQLGGRPDSISVKLLCGADMLESFGKPGIWKDEDIDAIVAKFGMVVITRDNTSPQRFVHCSDVLSRHSRNIHIVTEWIQNEISSTSVRRALRRGLSVKYLVQEPVVDYLRKNLLYGTHKKALSANSTDEEDRKTS